MLRSLFKRSQKPQKQVIPDTIPTGLQHSIIPIEYLNAVKFRNWDHDNKLYTNQIIIEPIKKEEKL